MGVYMSLPEVVSGLEPREVVGVRRPNNVVPIRPKKGEAQAASCNHKWWKRQESLPESERCSAVTSVKIEEELDWLESNFPELAPKEEAPPVVADSPRKRKTSPRKKK